MKKEMNTDNKSYCIDVKKINTDVFISVYHICSCALLAFICVYLILFNELLA